MKLIQHPSPNFGPRRNTDRPDMVILHYTAMATAQAALERLCDPGPEVSAHYLIAETGVVYQLVAEDMRAWHAGAGAWAGREDINSHSIGIELANRGDEPFSEPQMAALETVLTQALTRWGISKDRVLGHSDIAPGRKIDPGTRFPWSRLAHLGLAAAPPTAMSAVPDPVRFARAARAFGYTAAVEGDPITAYLTAFRLRFRQNMRDEPMDAKDVGLIEALAGAALTG